MSASSDDERARRRGAVPPPPSLAPGDAPESLDVPRMEPLSPSLEAMVQRGERLRKPEPKSPWLLWIIIALVTAALTMYVVR